MSLTKDITIRLVFSEIKYEELYYMTIMHLFKIFHTNNDRLCGLVVRVPG
jgi:hypothetical protein